MSFATASIGVGTIQLTTVNGEPATTYIDDVLYIPGVRWNLFSPGKARDQGFELDFDNTSGHYRSINHGAVCIDAYPEDGLWPFNAQSSMMVMSATTLTSTLSKRTLQEWHEAFGHINERYLKKMMNDHLVEGMKITTTTMTECDACQRGKQKRKTYPANVYRHVHQPNDLLYADLMTIKGTNKSKFKYILVIVDSFMTFTSVFLLTTKNEANHRMEEFFTWAEREQDHKVKQVLTDKGGEFVNNEISQWYAQLGIVHIICGPDAPQSNPTEQ